MTAKSILRFLPLLAALAVASCSTPAEISYFQDLYSGSSQEIESPMEIRIQPKDKISILVNSRDPKLADLFNLAIVSRQIGTGASTGQNVGLSGYTVDVDGNIDFPVIGKVNVAGKTREEIANTIKDELLSRDLIKDPVITVEFLNLTVSVLGEVNRPGRYNIDKDNITILDALSMAGDLTIYGVRTNVTVQRYEDGKRKSYSINLCSANQLYQSPVYYLKQNDIVYVEPNDTRARQSTVNGNNVRSTSFWISVGSLATSVITTLAVILPKIQAQ